MGKIGCVLIFLCIIGFFVFYPCLTDNLIMLRAGIPFCKTWPIWSIGFIVGLILLVLSGIRRNIKK